jgi:hypothetical protein
MQVLVPLTFHFNHDDTIVLPMNCIIHHWKMTGQITEEEACMIEDYLKSADVDEDISLVELIAKALPPLCEIKPVLPHEISTEITK